MCLPRASFSSPITCPDKHHLGVRKNARTHFILPLSKAIFQDALVVRNGTCGHLKVHHISPVDLCLQHKEFMMFENPHTGLHQLSHYLRNVYYHARKDCAGEQAKIIVPGDVIT